MRYTEYKFEPSFVAERLATYKSNLVKFTGKTDLIENGVRVMLDRLREDPKRYVDYGPYWWALKDVLARHGGFPAEHYERTLMGEYCGQTDEETIVVAEEFRRDYLDHFFVYTDEFVLDGETNEVWRLYDPDMVKLTMLADMMGEPVF